MQIEESPRTSISRVDGKTALTIAITKTQEANTVDVSETVKAALPGIEAKVAGSPQFTVVFDQAPYIQQSIDSLAEEGLLGLGFAVVVILVFLLSWRSTLVTAISIPTSVLLAAIGMQAAGYTLNIITLAALTIAIGRVVDDSIVVIENIKRHLQPGVDRGRAVLDAVREVAGAVTASTLTTVAVFLPVAFVAELVGELFRPFALTVTMALIASLLVSLTIVPVLAYWFLRAPRTHRHADAGRARGPQPAASASAAATGALASADDLHDAGTPDRLRRGYLPVLRWAIGRPALVLVLALLVLGGTAAAVPFVKTNYLGDSGQNTFTVTQDLEPGTSLDEQSDAARKVEGVLRDVSGVETVQTTIGSSGQSIQAAFGGGASASVQYNVTTDAGADQTTIQSAARDRIGRIDGVGEVSLSSGGGGFGGSSDIEVDVTAPTQAELETAAGKVLTQMRGVAGTTGATSNLSAAEPYLAVKVDRSKAAERGLTETQVGGIVAASVSPRDTGSVEIDDATLDVYIADPEPPTTIDALKALSIPTASGDVPLSDVATIEQSDGPTTITTSDAVRTATITVTPDSTNLGEAVQNVTAAVDRLDLPRGASATIGGVASSQSSAFSQLLLAVLVAVLIVYVIMVATFRSLRQPLMLLVSIPFAATGAVLLQIVTGIPLGVASIIGLLMLVGIVVTNAIVLIDLVNQYRRRGLRVREALVEGATRRLRPILMTALATIFALLPMAVGLTGKSGFISQPLALVVIGGLVSSTLLTLVVLPALYSVVEGLLRATGRPTGGAGRERDGADAGRPEASAAPTAGPGGRSAAVRSVAGAGLLGVDLAEPRDDDAGQRDEEHDRGPLRGDGHPAGRCRVAPEGHRGRERQPEEQLRVGPDGAAVGPLGRDAQGTVDGVGHTGSLRGALSCRTPESGCHPHGARRTRLPEPRPQEGHDPLAHRPVELRDRVRRALDRHERHGHVVGTQRRHELLRLPQRDELVGRVSDEERRGVRGDVGPGRACCAAGQSAYVRQPR